MQYNHLGVQTQSEKKAFLKTGVSKSLLAATAISSILYFCVLTFLFPKGNVVLWSFLILGEIYHIWLSLTFIYTIWDTEKFTPVQSDITPPVDVFITVCGEPEDVVKQTVRAAMRMDYPNFKVYILNDGFVREKPNWQEAEKIALELGATCITRAVPGGNKAGNINNGLAHTGSPLVAIFDADHAPHKNFLRKTASYFEDSTVGFVQSPQYYRNHALNQVTGGAWEQQELFFGAISKGKNRMNSVFMCGTNMVVRRSALLGVGGMCETNIAEDFLTSMFIHEQGWKSIYVPEVLSEGLAPEDLLSYYKQQFRWARGSLSIVFQYNPLFRKGLSIKQKIQYLASASYYLSGAVVLMNAVLPLIFLYFGLIPVGISTMTLAAVFLPYIFLSLYVLMLSTNFTFTFRALAFSMSSFSIFLKATWAAMTGQKSDFSITSKKQIQGNFISLTVPHLTYIAFTVGGLAVALLREGLSAAVSTNLSWALFNVAVFLPFLQSALPRSEKLPERRTVPVSDIQTETVTQIPANSSSTKVIGFTTKTIKGEVRDINFLNKVQMDMKKDSDDKP